METLFNYRQPDDKFITTFTDVTRADGRKGIMIIDAIGKRTDRRKKIISMKTYFPNNEEQSRINAGETFDEIISGYLR